MLPLAFFLCERRTKAAAVVLPGKQVEGEGYLPICYQIPSDAMQYIAIDADDANSLPTEPRRFPGKAIASPGYDGMKTDEQQKVLQR
jgi:hypothetical protein